eukprot:TRINITY_DN12068_c0_g1_i5.p1 TRINITY_DN12068_c0_g1~~TRINITY_DN12068_c0_g1_i5.p1  ORF type:complete len:134 (+),score=42.56 TRINITY_DN12068_c0_g1_i5:94-495(+)
MLHLRTTFVFFFLMIRRPPRSTLSSSSAASDVYKRQVSTQSTGTTKLTVMVYTIRDDDGSCLQSYWNKPAMELNKAGINIDGAGVQLQGGLTSGRTCEQMGYSKNITEQSKQGVPAPLRVALFGGVTVWTNQN